MDASALNNPSRNINDQNESSPSLEKFKLNPDDLKPTSKGVENAKKRLRAFSIQKKSSLSPIPPPKTICTTVGSVGTVFIGKLATSKPVLKPGDIEEVVDPKKPPKPPKPGTSKLQNVSFPLADYLNIQKKTLSEIEAMKRKMELVDLGIPLGLICPVSNSDKAMPTKAMPPIKSMLLDPAKVDEIIREAKQAKAEGKAFKFSYEKLLPTYQNPFQKNKDKDKDKEVPPSPNEDHRHSRDRRTYSDKYRRYSGHSDDKRSRDWHRESKDRTRSNIIRNREDRERVEKLKRSKEKSKRDEKSKTEKSKTDVKAKEKVSKEKKIDTINLTDEDDDVQELTEKEPEKEVKEADVNLKDFVVCDSWSENEEKAKDPTPKNDKKEETKIDAKTTPVEKVLDPMEQLKQSLLKEIDLPVECKVEKLQPVTDSFKYEIEDENDDEETLDMFAETATIKKVTKRIHKPIPHKTSLYDALVPIRFDYNDDNSNDEMDDSFLESVIAEIKQEDIDEEVPQDKGLVEYDISPKDDERESVTPELDDKIREMYSTRSDYSDGFKSVESVKSVDSNKSVESMKSTESGFKSTESGYKSTESRYKSAESLPRVREGSVKSIDSPKLKESGRKTSESRSKSTDSVKSTDSSNKFAESRHGSTERGQRSTKHESTMLSIEPAAEEINVNNMTKSTVDSLETWSFVMKICQPLLFRHDKNKCYRETQNMPKIWWCENPKLCDCVKDRSIVYEELEMCKMELVDNVYGTYQVQEAIYPEARGWYPAAFLAPSEALPQPSEWEAEDSQERPTPPPHSRHEIVLDREYQNTGLADRFMEAVWPDVEGAAKSETPLSTPVRETKKRPGEEPDAAKKKKMKLNEGKHSSEGWSQESEVEEDLDKNKKQKSVKLKRKRKHSTDSEDESPSKKKKKAMKKEKKEKAKSKIKRQRLSKKYLKKLKMKQERLKKKKAKLNESDADDQERERKKREKKLKKRKLLKLKKKASKKKSKARSSSPSSSDSELNRKKKKEKRKKRKKRKQSTSESNQSDELFDVNILKNIKTERLTDDEKAKNFSPNKKHREIINVKQLQNDFVSIQIKKEIEDVNSPDDFEESFTEEEKKQMEMEGKEIEEVEKEEVNKETAEVEREEIVESVEEKEKEEKTLELEHEFKEPEITRPQTPQQKPVPDENNSQCSSQESITSVKPYEKDDSHLRPSSQNSNYNFHDVMQNETHDNELYSKDVGMEMEGGYEQGNYEMYEQMAMEYQSDVASQRLPPPDETSGRIETVVMSRARGRGEIKCDWRAGDPAAPRPPRRAQPPSPGDTPRTSRWGLKPSEVNIVLTGGGDEQGDSFHPERAMSPTVYKIQSLANRTDTSNLGYDEAYMDMYGAADRLQYGDCFSREFKQDNISAHHSSLDDRIDMALRTTVLGDVAKTETQEIDEENKGILVTKSLAESRSVKRVTFADGYKPGQDSDTEEPPVRKRKKVRRTGCPWPCPATHPDHVSLWDALPPPPPPPGSPPPPPRAPPPPASLLRAHRQHIAMLRPPHPMNKFDPSSLAAFMPPEPPPGLISF